MDIETAKEHAKEYLLMGTRVKAGDESDLLKATVDSVNRILKENMKTIKAAEAAYVESDDIDAFTLALLPIHYRILYEAYAPYWLEHCIPVTDHDDDAEFTYYNDLIDMYWAWKWQEWKKKGEWCVTIMLPPTRGLMNFAYQEEKRSLQEYYRKLSADENKNSSA